MIMNHNHEDDIVLSVPLEQLYVYGKTHEHYIQLAKNSLPEKETVELTLSLDSSLFEMMMPNATITIKGNNVDKIIGVGSAGKITLTKGSQVSVIYSTSTSALMKIDDYVIEFKSNSRLKFSGTYSFVYDAREENPLDSTIIFKENSVVTVSTFVCTSNEPVEEVEIIV